MKIKILGVIIPDEHQWVYDYFNLPATSYGKISSMLDSATPGEALEIEINSPGGDVYSASQIYTALKSYSGKVIVTITGMAASAASVIAMAGTTVRMSPTAQMMIHNVSSYAKGDYRDMDHMSEVLQSANNTIVNAYVLKSGKDRAELLKLMDAETYLSPQRALELGLIDEILFDTDKRLVASTGAGMLPAAVINYFVNHPPGEAKVAADVDFLKAKIKILKLK